MAENKKGFILYADQKTLFEKLPNEKAGELIKHIFSYVNDENPITDDLLIEIAFEPIKSQLKRDLKRFEDAKKQRSEAGKKSAAARKKQRSLTPVESVQRTSTKSTVKDNVNVKVKDIRESAHASFFKDKNEFFSWFNKKRTEYLKLPSNFNIMSYEDQNNFKQLKIHKSLNDFEQAMKVMCKSKWVIDNKMSTISHFLKPENFEKYLNGGKYTEREFGSLEGLKSSIASQR